MSASVPALLPPPQAIPAYSPSQPDIWSRCEALVHEAEQQTRLLDGEYLLRQREAVRAVGELLLFLPLYPTEFTRYVRMAARLTGMALCRRPHPPFGPLLALLECLRPLPLDERTALRVEALAALLDNDGLSAEAVEALAQRLEHQDAAHADALSRMLAGMLYCRISYINNAIDCYYSYIYRYESGLPFLHQTFCLSVSITALYCNKFSMSYGIIESFRNTYELTGSNYLSSRWKTHLVFFLLHLGRTEEALEHLDQLLSLPQIAGVRATGCRLRRALALYHYKEGRPRAAVAVLGADTAVRTARGIAHSEFNDPQVLEMLYDLREQPGGDRIPGYELDAVLRRCLADKDQLLRGVALRLEARDRLKAGQRQQARAAFEESLAALLRTGSVDAVVGVGVEYGLLLQDMGDAAAERRLRDQLRAVTKAGEERLPPVPGAHPPHAPAARSGPLPPLSPDDGDASGLESVRRCVALLASGSPSASADEGFSQLVGLVQRSLGAQRAALFRPAPSGEHTLAGASNLTSVEVQAPEFRRTMEYLKLRCGQARPENPVLLRKEGRALGLAVFVDEGAPWLLYMDNSFQDGFFAGLSARASELLGAVLAAEARALGRERRLRRVESRDAAADAGRDVHPPVFWGQGMDDVLHEAALVAQTEASVLIRGETGVGKERLARYLHQCSECLGAFVPVQISCLPEQLFESELFGYEKGAFTGAVRSKPGRVELAHQGVLFLDEVGDLPPLFQIKLLRFLQEREFLRVGGMQPLRAQFRLVAATHKDLWREVRAGRFREDLYYRLAVVTLDIPPLRARQRDILPLAELFQKHYALRAGRAVRPFTPAERDALAAHSWPGNIRELQNVVERAVALDTTCRPMLVEGDGGVSSSVNPQAAAAWAAPVTSSAVAAADGLEDLLAVLHGAPTLETLEDAYIRHVLRRTGGKVHGPDGALRVLGMKKTSFYARMKRAAG